MVIDINTGKKFLIVERSRGDFYAYTEDANHHAVVQPKRLKESVLVHQQVLDNDCDLSIALPSDGHFIFELKN